MIELSQAWWYMPVIQAPRRLKQEDHDLETRLGYIANSRQTHRNKKR
jgi:hypothetical protein